jgi:two-component system chemotaxis sensor kinase CheA
VVIKSLEENFERIEGIAGGTILGDGNVALIIDVQGIKSMHFDRRNAA